MDPFLGEIRLFPWDFNPRGWALCQGQLLPLAQNQALFALLGVQYGGNGQTTFGLPDLRGRTPAGQGGSYGSAGATGGVENVALTISTMPSHTHALVGTTAAATIKGPLNHMFGSDNTDLADFYGPPTNLVAIAPASVSQTGGNQPHPNIQPYLTLNYCIATSGIFPSRN